MSYYVLYIMNRCNSYEKRKIYQPIIEKFECLE